MMYTAQAGAAVDPAAFKVRGVGLRMTRAEVAKVATLETRPARGGAKRGVDVCLVEFKDGGPSFIQLTFLDGKVIMMTASYMPADLEKVGGAEKLLVSLEEQLGPAPKRLKNRPQRADPSIINKIEAAWHAREKGLMFSFESFEEKRLKGDMAELSAYDNAGMAELDKREKTEKKVDPGF